MTDFYSESSFTQAPVSSARFGITDIKDSKKPSFTVEDSNFTWIATVENPDGKAIRFTGIDYNEYFSDVLKPSDSKCDGMLFYDGDIYEALIFVELKTGLNTAKWIYKAKKQLLNTIDVFKKYNADEFPNIKRREAYAANSIDENTAVPRQNDIEDFFIKGFDFYTKYKIMM